MLEYDEWVVPGEVEYAEKKAAEIEPKIFDLPTDDIRNSLLEWEESLLSDDLRREIIVQHSIRHMAADAVKYLDGDWQTIKRDFNLSDTKCDRVMKTIDRKLNSKSKSVVFTDLEEKIADYIKGYYGWHFWPYEVE